MPTCLYDAILTQRHAGMIIYHAVEMKRCKADKNSTWSNRRDGVGTGSRMAKNWMEPILRDLSYLFFGELCFWTSSISHWSRQCLNRSARVNCGMLKSYDWATLESASHSLSVTLKATEWTFLPRLLRFRIIIVLFNFGDNVGVLLLFWFWCCW